MPSPFSNKKNSQTKVSETLVPIKNSTLVCEFCFCDTSDGTYDVTRKVLTWQCVVCQKPNIVKDIEL